MYRNFVKRMMDLVFASLFFILLSPVFLLTVVLLIVANSGSPFFFQARPGKNGRLFTLVKFKTMNNKRDQHGSLLPDFKRLTAIGKLLRKTSLDEIPQLLNVMKGDMSLVGPRPLLPEYLPLYNLLQARRHEVLPGITGWAQVNGRNAISWEQKFAYDVWYVDHISFKTDMRIVLLTIRKVITGDRVNSSDKVTMEKFSGQEKEPVQ